MLENVLPLRPSLKFGDGNSVAVEINIVLVFAVISRMTNVGGVFSEVMMGRSQMNSSRKLNCFRKKMLKGEVKKGFQAFSLCVQHDY
jgi:hypothetical protein